MRTSSRFNRRPIRRRRSMNERIDLVDTQFALQSLEDDSMFVASEESEEVAEAEDDETGIPFTNSMDENIVMLFPTHDEAKQFAEDNDMLDKVKIVCVTIHPDEEAEAEVEECDMRGRMGESYRIRRNRARRLGESRMARRPAARPARPSRMSRRISESRRAFRTGRRSYLTSNQTGYL